MQILLIDDRRNLPATRVARNYADGIAALQERHWDLLLLDHDLGDFSGPNGREMKGYDIACWLEEHQEHLPGDVRIVSDNSVGAENIVRALSRFYPHKYWWK
jgi:hypothetical protein